MNWLMWIGGFFPFWALYVTLFKCFFLKEELNFDKSKGETTDEYFAGVFLVFAPLLIWAWVCWRFIS